VLCHLELGQFKKIGEEQFLFVPRVSNAVVIAMSPCSFTTLIIFINCYRQYFYCKLYSNEFLW